MVLLIRMAPDLPSRSTEPHQETPQETSQPPARPPGELGGHTVQPWEQDAVPPTTTPNSKDVPPPEMGTIEARERGPGPGAKATAAPGNQPSGASPGHGRSVAQASMTPEAQAATTAATTELPGSEGADAFDKGVAPSQARPPRPPVYKPQNGHEPAPRPPPAQVAQARAAGPKTEGDALVEAITKAIGENLAKAFHQSIAQAVRDFMPLSGRSIAQPKVDVGPNLTKAAPKPKATPATPAPPATAPAPATAAATGATSATTAAAGPVKPQEAKPAPQVDPSAPTPLGTPLDAPKPSQYGGTIEPADEQAKAKLAAAGNPNNPAIGQPAQESADRETREGNLA